MALVVLVSAKGAPGVTTLTVALAALTPGAVAADLDPDGGDLALRYRREDGSPLDLDQGLLSLAASLRRGPNDFVGSGPIDAHLQVTGGGLEVLLGVKGPDQAIGLGPLWSPLARALTETDRPVFADCGRIGPASPAMPVLMVADAVIMVARAELEELAHLRERLRFLVATLPSRYSGRARVGVVLVAAERDRAAGPRTEQLLRSSGVAVSVLGTVADDVRGAGRLRGLAGGNAGRTTLVRSVRSLLPAVRVLAGDVPEVTRLRTGPGLLAAPAPGPEPGPPGAVVPLRTASNGPNGPHGSGPSAPSNGRHAPELPPPLLQPGPPLPQSVSLDDDTAERPPLNIDRWGTAENLAPAPPAEPDPLGSEYPLASTLLEPTLLEPTLLEPTLLEPTPLDASEPSASEQSGAEPGPGELDVPKPDGPELNGSKLDVTEPGTPEPDATELAGIELNAAVLDGTALDAGELDAAELDVAELDHPRIDPLTSPYRPALFSELGLRDDVPATAGPNGGE